MVSVTELEACGDVMLQLGQQEQLDMIQAEKGSSNRTSPETRHVVPQSEQARTSGVLQQSYSDNMFVLGHVHAAVPTRVFVR